MNIYYAKGKCKLHPKSYPGFNVHFFVACGLLMLSPSAYYLQQKEQQTLLLSKATKDINRIAMLRLWVGLAFIGAGIWAFRGGEGWQWWIAVAVLALFLVLVRRHHRETDKKELVTINLSLLENELKALEGDTSSFPDGAAYTNIAHPYSYDLDLFGKGSVFQALCRVVTMGGHTLLVDKLSSLTLIKETITERQQIIKELSTMPAFLQDFRAAGTVVKEGAKDQAHLTEWLEAGDRFIHNRIVRIAAVVMPVLSVAFLIWCVVSGGISSWGLPIVVINWVLLGRFQKDIKLAVQQTGNAAQLVEKYEKLLQQTSVQEFTSPWLKTINANAKNSLAHITQFKKLVNLFDSRSNGMTGSLVNSLFLFDFYCLLKLEAWRGKHQITLLKAIDDMAALDVNVSCAVYAFNQPAHIYPEITESSCEIKAVGLRHPLLVSKIAVGNDFVLGKHEQFYLLTGANMTGKSTFIRTIGVCNVMGNMGLPLPAHELSLPLLDLYTSMRITDSVQEDISYFRAELNRIKSIMDIVRVSQQPYLVLLDEPLRGTNSTDKQQGTRSIVETLLTCHAIGIVATHDTGLCDMETSFPGKVSNYHFESKVETGGLSFDFKLKSGCSTSNNATVLMRQMGIIR